MPLPARMLTQADVAEIRAAYDTEYTRWYDRPVPGSDVEIMSYAVLVTTIVAAANAYLDAFLEGKGDLVPWGYPCNRTEGGMHTGTGAKDDSCQVGVPSGVNIANRHFVVDETIGAVVAFCTFGAGGPTSSGSADTHLFRIEGGKLRYVHTLTHLLQANFQGNAKGKGAPPAQGKGKQ